MIQKTRDGHAAEGLPDQITVNGNLAEEVRPDANGLQAGALEKGEKTRHFMRKNGPVADATRAHQCGCDHYSC